MCGAINFSIDPPLRNHPQLCNTMIVKSLLGIFLAFLLISVTEQAPTRRDGRPIFSDRVENFLRSLNNEGMTDREKIKYLGEILSALSYYKYDDPNFLEHCVGQKIVQDGYRDVQRQPYDDDQEYDNQYGRVRTGDRSKTRYKDQSRGQSYGPSSQQYDSDHGDDYSNERRQEYGGDSRQQQHGDRNHDRHRFRGHKYRGTPYPSHERGVDGHSMRDDDHHEGHDGSYEDNLDQRQSHSDRQQDNQYGRPEERRIRNRDPSAAGYNRQGSRSQERGIDGHGSRSSEVRGEVHSNDHEENDDYDEKDHEYDNHDQIEELPHDENYDYYDEDEQGEDEDGDHSNQEQSIDGHDPHRTAGERHRDDGYSQRGSQSDQNSQSGARDTDGSRSREVSDRDNRGFNRYDPYSSSRGHDDDRDSRRGYDGNQAGDSDGSHHDSYDPYGATSSDAHDTHQTSREQDGYQDHHYEQRGGEHGIQGEPYAPYGEESPYLTGDAVEHSGDYDNSQFNSHLLEEYLNRIYMHDVPEDLAQYARSYLDYAKDSVRSSASQVKNFENIRPCLEHLVQYFNILTDNLASEYKRCSTKCYYDRLTNFTNSVSQYTRTTTECIYNRRN
ncbi:sarcoplasmic reticulum histidine-rich calcium-binding protein-like [Lutzomyia longipalpis]|uniref:sarcoplasmic reticulum histidine-rich calcium-binding protein-like n=1 Tax=Lutzomyia longipalpis TaxID=7200 RepID=UPI002483CC73|nr:sarcoplasmic reticulum histidine-rich calcium-binding protein-like [Lutzomyia longipalpis]